MGLKDFIKSIGTLLKVAKKPGRREFILALRITLIGIFSLGIIAFIIRFIAIALQTI